MIVIRFLFFVLAASVLLALPARAGVVFEQSDAMPSRAPVAPVADAGLVVPITGKAGQKPATYWRIQTNEQLAEVFRRWAKSADWQLAWEVPDLVALAGVEITGDFEEAVGKTSEALNRSGNALQARFYVANRVLRIVERK